MLLAKVMGTVVMTIKHPAYEGEKLLAVQFLDADKKPSGPQILAFDRAQAGVGDTVLVMREGNGVRQILGRDHGLGIDEAITKEVPVRSLIVGIVDQVHHENVGQV
jgi:ethanolamine utilization protein EutN